VVSVLFKYKGQKKDNSYFVKIVTNFLYHRWSLKKVAPPPPILKKLFHSFHWQPHLHKSKAKSRLFYYIRRPQTRGSLQCLASCLVTGTNKRGQRHQAQQASLCLSRDIHYTLQRKSEIGANLLTS
jgi:hypothetical protein